MEWSLQSSGLIGHILNMIKKRLHSLTDFPHDGLVRANSNLNSHGLLYCWHVSTLLGVVTNRNNHIPYWQTSAIELFCWQKSYFYITLYNVSIYLSISLYISRLLWFILLYDLWVFTKFKWTVFMLSFLLHHCLTFEPHRKWLWI